MVPREGLLDTASENPGSAETPPENSPKKNQKSEADDKPRRGRPKGLPKTGGRKKNSSNWTSERRREYFIERGLLETLGDIVEGREMLTSGPTGRPLKARPSIELRAKTAVGIYQRCWPEEIETTNRTTVTSRSDPAVDRRKLAMALGASPETRQLARAILDITRDGPCDDGGHAVAAGEAGLGPIAAVPLAPPALSGSDASDSDVEAAREQIGNGLIELVRREPGPNGRELWHIFDSMGEARGAEWGRDTARKKANQLINEGKLT